MRILLAEDDHYLRESLTAAMILEGYATDWVLRGDKASKALHSASYDALVLDIGLPGKTGLELLQNLRQKGGKIPVILLTVRDSISDRVRGLDIGADDYISKPFNIDELFARLRSLLRRNTHGILAMG